MRILLSLLLTFLPSFLENPIRRVLFNQKIGKGSKIGVLAIVYAKKMVIGRNVKIQSFALVKAEELYIGDNTCIKSLAFISTRIIHLKKYVHIANFTFIRGPFMEHSKIEIGNHSRVFPFCWLDTNQLIKIGDNVGIGGFSLIFTHGVWSNYFKGGPITFKDVIIENNVWLPWKVFVMPGVTIGENSIIGANSLVNKSIGKNSLAAGSPAKILKEDFLEKLSEDELKKRLNRFFQDFFNFLIFKKKISSYKHFNEKEFTSKKFQVFIENNNNNVDRTTLLVSTKNNIKVNIKNKKIFIWNLKNDTIYFNEKNEFIEEFISFIRRYGVRLNKMYKDGNLY